MLISTEKKNKKFSLEKDSKESSNRQSCKMDYSPCFNEEQKRIIFSEKEDNDKTNFQDKIRKSIQILLYFEKKFNLEDFATIQKILGIENLPASFSMENEKTSSNASVLKDSLLFKNFCEGVFQKELKKILSEIFLEYKSLIKLSNCNNKDFDFDFACKEISEKNEEEKGNLECLKLKWLFQRERIKNLFAQLAAILDKFEFKRDANLEHNLNDAFVVLETLMHIFSSYFVYFREKLDFDFSASTEAGDFLQSEKAACETDDNQPIIYNNNLNNNNNINRNFTKAHLSFNSNSFGIFDGLKKNENPEKKKAEGFKDEKPKQKANAPMQIETEKNYAISNFIAKETSEKQKKISENKLRFICFVFNLFEEENFLNLFNCLLFTLNKIKNKTFHSFYSAINQKHLTTLFTSGKKAIKHFDNLIAFLVFAKKVLSQKENFHLHASLLKISEFQVNRFFIQCEFFEQIVFEYFLLNFKDEHLTFFDKFSGLNADLDNQLLFFSSFLNFWNKEKFYTVHYNIDFNTVFFSCTDALYQMINLLKPKLTALLNELFEFFADPNKFLLLKQQQPPSAFFLYLNSVSLCVFKAFVDFLRQFICNHVFAAFVNDNNFEMINRSVWIKPVIDLFSIANFTLKLLQVSEILKSELNNNNSNSFFINNNNNNKNFNMENQQGFKITEELVYKFFSFVFTEMFQKILSTLPKRMLYIREVFTLNFLFLFLNFLEKTPFYLEFLRANPAKEIISALEKIAKFQNKFFFLLANYSLKLIFPEQKHKLRIYSFHNFPLDYLEIEESESLKTRISEVIFRQADPEAVKDRKNAIQDGDNTNPNNGFGFAEKSNLGNLKSQKINLNNGIDNANCFGVNYHNSGSRSNFDVVSDRNCEFISEGLKSHVAEEEFIEEDVEISSQEVQGNLKSYFYGAQPNNNNNNNNNNHHNYYQNNNNNNNHSEKKNTSDAIIIDSIVNNLNKPSNNNNKSNNKNENKPDASVEKAKTSKSKSKDYAKQKSLSKAQIKKRLSFQTEIYYDFSALIANFQLDHLKFLEKINCKKLKFNFLSRNNKIANLTINNSQSFENSLSSGEKVYLKITNTKASFVLVQKEDEILFFDDSNFSELKSFFGFDMLNKADLEYFLLIGEENLKDNNLMLQNFLNNFEDCELKNPMKWEAVIENMYLFLD